MFKAILLMLACAFALACGGSGGTSSQTIGGSGDSLEGTDETSSTAEYELTFEAEWSAATHPTDFPNNPHFSGLIGLTHKSTTSIWSSGNLATTGIKNVAETGSKSQLSSEISDLINAGLGFQEISGGGISPSPGSVSVTFSANSNFPFVSVVSMIAPSPDWIVGVNSTNLMEDGAFVSTKSLDLYPYDAGTDSGASYASANSPTNPAEAVFRITSEPFLNGGNLQRLGRFIFVKQ